MPTPAAEIAVDVPLVRRLLGEQHPDLAEQPLRLVANGWDNLILRLGDALAVRLPRRAAAADLVRHEHLVLPRLAPLLPVTVPVPVRVGMPADGYPWHWSVVPWFDGDAVADVDLRGDRDLASDLGEFVVALHRPADPDAPVNPMRGVSLGDRADVDRERLLSSAAPRAAEVERVRVDALEAEPWSGPPVWLHGDLHPANLLTANGRLSAVVDFGDVTAGDPATDLATAWLTFDADARGTFRDHVRPDPATWRRARGWAVALGAAFVAEPGSRMHDIGLAALAEVLLPD